MDKLKKLVNELSSVDLSEHILYRKVSSDTTEDLYAPYVEWHVLVDALDKIYSDWSYDVTVLEVTNDYVSCKAVIEIEGVRRSGIGVAVIRKSRSGVLLYEVAIKKAEHDALKRALIKFGLGRKLYAMKMINKDEYIAWYRKKYGLAYQDYSLKKKMEQGVYTGSAKVVSSVESSNIEEVNEVINMLKKNSVSITRRHIDQLEHCYDDDPILFAHLQELVSARNFSQFFKELGNKYESKNVSKR